jgi:hypothetical protein
VLLSELAIVECCIDCMEEQGMFVKNSSGS